MSNCKKCRETCFSSIERLYLLGGRGESRYPGIEYDIAIQQDIFHRRLGQGSISALVRKEKDFSFSGDSLASWLYRLGGDKAIIEWLSEPNSEKFHAIALAQYMLADTTWMHRLARTEQELLPLR